MFILPVMGDGSGFTVTSCVLKQPVGKVYVIVVIPIPPIPGLIAEIPVTIPVLGST
jgi:hypothetical protein